MKYSAWSMEEYGGVWRNVEIWGNLDSTEKFVIEMI